MPRLHRLAASAGLILTCLSAIPLSAQTTVAIGGTTFVNKGLVGVGRVPASLRDRLGETFGSLSGLAVDSRTWRR
ncbi:MAG: hypothetical protein ABIQ12_00290, partial [Opitutaceae bacterium]